MFPLDSTLDAADFRRLQNELNGGPMIAFVGAGMSARVNFGVWSKLLEDLRSEADTLPGTETVAPQQQSARIKDADIKETDLPWAAEIIRRRFQSHESRYFQTLGEFFSRQAKPDPAIEAFARIPFTHMFTTNYDGVLEAALQQAGRTPTVRNWRIPEDSIGVMDSLLSWNTAAPELIYLHGKYDRPETIVLSERDYRSQYVKSDETTRRLFAIFALRRAAFFGFSFDDADVTSVFRAVRSSTGSVPRHFAILAASHDGKPMSLAQRDHKRLRMIEKFGITPIFYDSSGSGDHAHFESIVVALEAATAATVQAPGKPPAPVAVNGSEEKARKNGPPRVAFADELSTATESKLGDGDEELTWAQRPEFRKLRGKADKDDPQKGRFGGKSINNNRELSVSIDPADYDEDWFDIVIKVTATEGAPPVEGKVDLWVHDSFPQEHYYTFARKGVAKFSFRVWGAFTVGATCDKGMTPLELDLATIKGVKGWPPRE